jgi:hypothetical protein
VKKHSSKSASGSRRTSSRSGTSGRAAATGSPAPAELSGPFAALLARARSMTPADKKVLLITAGILTADGELAPHYRSKASAIQRVLGVRKKAARRVGV